MACIKLLFYVLLHLSLTTATVIRTAPSTRIRSVCYGDFGCYVPRPGSTVLPESPEKVNTTFFLYTRNNPIQAKLISASNLDSFDPTKSIKLIIHGFNDAATNKWVTGMAKELLISEDMNVIAVDWSGGNRFPYDQAVANTVIAAAVIRQLLQAMINMGAQPQQIHLIGHSLGAHISSYVGRDLRNLGRISGLDPAGPDFYTSGIPDRLDSSDALFVDVIHTDGAPRIQSGFGLLDPVGHVDFYPNGGSAQPTCTSNTADMLLQSFWDLISTMNIETAVDTVACNHMSAVFYYADSINTPSPAFAYPCSDYKSFVEGLCTSCGPNGNQCQQVGYHASPNGTLGILYLMTIHGIKPPHFGFHFKVTLQSDMNNGQQTRGIFKVKFNEQEEEISLFDQNTLIKHDSSNSKTIIITDNPIPLEEISISFRKTYDIYFGIGFADEWSFRSVTVLDMQSNIEYTFCPKSNSLSMIKSSSSLTYQLCV
jgi:pimeloyl-ACP methyl ester carboxylesterase